MYLKYHGGICPVEPDFGALFKVLGDKEAQDQIRRENRDAVHCPFLIDNPNHCTGCKQNPFSKDRRPDLAVVDEWAESIEHGLELLDLVDMGFRLELSEIDPEEMTLMRILRSEIAKYQAEKAKEKAKS